MTCAASAAVSQARLWVQLMKELRQGVKLKKVQEQPFDPLPTEFSLTPFEMLMQDIRARKFQLRKVMVRDASRHCSSPQCEGRRQNEMITTFKLLVEWILKPLCMKVRCENRQEHTAALLNSC